MLKKGYQGTFGKPPTSGPKAQKDKNVWIISCGQASSACSVPANAQKAAAEAIGWNVTLFDGKLNPTTYAQGIQKAIAAGADGMMFVGVSCQEVLGPLKQAKQAGIKTVTLGAADCDSQWQTSGSPVFTTETIFNGGLNWDKALQSWGALKAAWIIEHTHGKAKVLEVTGTKLYAPDMEHVGFMAEMKKCSGCDVVEVVDLGLSDLAPQTEQAKVSAALQQHPEATVMDVFSDGFLAPALRAAKALGNDKITVMGGECFAPTPDLIRSGGIVKACDGYPQEWAGWASVDALNRQFADPDSKPVDQGMGFQLVDATHNLPGKGQDWHASVDYKAAYKKLWGVG